MAEKLLTVKVPGDRTRLQVDLQPRDMSPVSITTQGGWLRHRIHIPEHSVSELQSGEKVPTPVASETRVRWSPRARGALRRVARELGVEIDSNKVRKIVSAPIVEAQSRLGGFKQKLISTKLTAEMDVPSPYREAEVRILRHGEEEPVLVFQSTTRRRGTHPTDVLRESVATHSKEISGKI